MTKRGDWQVTEHDRKPDDDLPAWQPGGKSAEVEFSGGPADGKRLVVQADEDGSPAPIFKTPGIPAEVFSADEPPPELYRLDVNPADDGPLWLYRHLGSATP
jgi:hypothetical protein